MNLHIDTRLKKLGDPQRSFMWELLIPQVNKVSSVIKDPMDLSIRVRSVSLPGRGNETITSNYMGMKQLFAGKATYGNTITLSIEEFQDFKGWRTFYDWSQLIFDTNPNHPRGGASNAIQKSGTGGYAVPVYLQMKKFSGDDHNFRFKIVNAFPSQLEDISLDYTNSDSIKFNVTLTYDFVVIE